MSQHRQNVIEDGRLRLDVLIELTRKPSLFEPGEPHFWTDPHIAERMLAAHLDPDLEAASRPPEVIDRTVDWLISRLNFQPGARILDLGCGPGLYSTRLASAGMDITGVDFSANSIDYARQAAQEQGLEIAYRCQDYLTLDDEDAYEAMLLIYGDLCVLPDRDRDGLLERVYRALHPGGSFVFDVSAPPARETLGTGRTWSVADGGFWRPGEHVVLEEVFDYPDEPATCRQVAVIDGGGELAIYRLWFRYYDPDGITSLMERHGFEVCDLFSDLAGTPYRPESHWIGVVARKPR